MAGYDARTFLKILEVPNNPIFWRSPSCLTTNTQLVQVILDILGHRTQSTNNVGLSISLSMWCRIHLVVRAWFWAAKIIPSVSFFNIPFFNYCRVASSSRTSFVPLQNSESNLFSRNLSFLLFVMVLFFLKGSSSSLKIFSLLTFSKMFPLSY